jgi:hypothetical protein
MGTSVREAVRVGWQCDAEPASTLICRSLGSCIGMAVQSSGIHVNLQLVVARGFRRIDKSLHCE